MGAAKRPDYARLDEDDRQSCDEYVPREFLQTRRHRDKWILSVGCFVFGIVIGALLLKMFQGLPLLANWNSPKARLHRLLQMPTEVSVFRPNDLFASTPSPKSDQAWEELLGPTRGFVNFKNPQEEFGLRPGRPVPDDPNSAVYGISMFHQLHCLIMIRDIYYGVLLGDYNLTDYQAELKEKDDHEHAHEKAGKWFKIEHTKHCFDYLQQSIRCAGLMEVEMPQGPARNIFDGYGSPHTCKRWDDIMDFMEEYRATDE